MTPGPFEILVVILVILVVFGAGRIPTISENLAKGIKSFKKGLREDDTPPRISESQKKDD